MRSDPTPYLLVVILACLELFIACNHISTGLLPKEKTAHSRYAEQLKTAGLSGTVLSNKWFNAAERSLQFPITIKIPYHEKAYFSSDQPNAMGYRFDARIGELLQILISPQSLDHTQFFIDLFEDGPDSAKQNQHLISAKTDSSFLYYVFKQDGQFILRIQPELLSEVSFDLYITASPSLSNPVPLNARQNIGSFFGMERDAGIRKHEGIDIFAERLTPALAAADGIISQVGTNNLGGKTVSLSPIGRPISLYYAHLDSQIVTAGQLVAIGDTIGLIGNTGNARTTPPHLHFGIYTAVGAIDPLPFINPGKSQPSKITSDKARVGDTVRTLSTTDELPIHTPLLIEAAMLNGYRVITPNKKKFFIIANKVTAISNSIKSITLEIATDVYREPNSLAAKITEYPPGKTVQIIGNYNRFQLIESDFVKGWIMELTN